MATKKTTNPPTLVDQLSGDPLKVVLAAACLWGGYQLFTYRVEQLEKIVSGLSLSTTVNTQEISGIKIVLDRVERKLDDALRTGKRQP